MTVVSSKFYRNWMLVIAFFIVLIVLVGGITRLTHSGLSMVEWKPVYGILPPLNQTEWNRVFEAYKQFPEYKQLRYGMSLFEFKVLFFWEYLHRVLARILGLIILLPTLFLFVTGKFNGYMKRQSLVMLALVLVQGLAGWLMVKSGLVDRPDVSHFRLAVHLLLAFALFQYVMWTFWEVGDGPNDEVVVDYLPAMSTGIGILVLVVLQIGYGAFVAGLDAGFGYNTFPKMNGEWIPITAGSMRPYWVNFLSNPVMVQFIHRLLAVWILVRSVLLGVMVLRSSNGKLIIAYAIFCAALILQIILGILTLLYIVPLPLALLHQLGGLAVLTATIYFLYTLCWLRGGRDS